MLASAEIPSIFTEIPLITARLQVLASTQLYPHKHDFTQLKLNLLLTNLTLLHAYTIFLKSQLCSSKTQLSQAQTQLSFTLLCLVQTTVKASSLKLALPDLTPV